MVYGCNMNQIAADQTANLMAEAAPAFDAFWDYEIAGAGMPGGIMQLEAMLAVSPDNEELLLSVAKGYVGYGVGWLENDYEIADHDGEFEKAERLQHRVRLLYLRARNLALHAMRNRDAGIDEAVKDAAVLEQYLDEHYTKPEDVGLVFWLGTGWGAAINMGLDDPDLLADMPVVKALMEHSAALDQSYFNYGCYIFLAGLEAAIPEAFGGDPAKGKELFERALSLTKRRNHMLHINYARTYAVNARDKELYVNLLTEVIEAPDLGNDVRLNNKIARVRAQRYLAETNEIF